jgi:peptide/nickel transport system permease protein
VASVVVFSLLHLAPGDPASVIAGPDATPDVVAAIRHSLGLDQPLVTQYFSWIGGIFTGNLGTSYTVHEPISTLIGQRLQSTLQLTVAASIIMTLLGLTMGVVSVTSKHKAVTKAIDSLGTFALALPPFVSGVILIFIFAVVWKVLPSGGDASLMSDPGEALRRLVLPSVAMALPGAPVIGRLLSTEMRRMAEQEFMLTALAKGASRRWMTWRHLVPNSLGPAIIELGIRMGQLLGGAIVCEAIFARAGLGSLLIQSVELRDYRLAQVLLLMAIGAAIMMQLAAELSIARIDPRVRFGDRS